MRSHLRTSSLLLLAVVGSATLLGSHARAQSVLQKGQRGNTGGATTLQPVAPPLTQSVVNVLTDSFSGTADVASNGAFDGVPVLNGFHFRFGNGDHELQRVGVTVASPSSATVVFRDRNADDNYKAEATWINVKGGGTRGEVFAVGAGQFEVPLPTPRPANYRLVLSGFELRFETDEHVRMVGIWLDEARNVARISLSDYVQDTSIGGHLGNAGLPPHSARGWFDGTVPSMGHVEQKMKAGKDYSIRSVGVRLQYAFIPNAIVEGEDYFTGTARAPASGKVFGSRAAIQGFEFWFDNKEHHLREIGVMPPLAGAATRTRVPANEFIEFQDTNRDDPIKWAVKLVNLKP